MHWPDRKDSGWGILNRPGEFKNRKSRDRQVCGRGATRLRRDFLARGPSFSRLMAVESWFSFLFASYNGALIVFLTEIMPADVRTAGFSLAHSSATAIFSGFTPAISTYLIHSDPRDWQSQFPGLWLSFAAACRLIATALLSSSRLAQLSTVHDLASQPRQRDVSVRPACSRAMICIIRC